MILFGAIGLTTGLTAGVIGAGGGFLTLTLLLATGMTPKHAVGTALVFVLVIAAWSSLVHLRQGTGDPFLALLLGLPAAVTSFVAARSIDKLPDRVITLGFLVLIVLVTAAFLKTPKSETREALLVEPLPDAPPRRGRRFSRTVLTPAGEVHYGFGVPKVVGGGAVVGVMQGLFGVGGGFMLVPYMVAMLKIPENVAVGVSLMAIVIGSISGSIAHLTLGNVDTSALLLLVPGGLIGSLIGAKVSGRLSPAVIRAAFLAVMVGAAIYLLAREVL